MILALSVNITAVQNAITNFLINARNAITNAIAIATNAISVVMILKNTANAQYVTTVLNFRYIQLSRPAGRLFHCQGLFSFCSAASLAVGALKRAKTDINFIRPLQGGNKHKQEH